MTASSQKILSPEEIAVRAGEQLTFLHLPEPGVFAERALRLRALAAGHVMRDFLLFVAELAEAQHRALSAAVAVPLPTAEQIDKAASAGAPLLPAEHWPRAPVWPATSPRARPRPPRCSSPRPTMSIWTPRPAACSRASCWAWTWPPHR